MADKKTLIKISSTNCRGLGDYSKRKYVFNYLRNNRYGIYCLQDTHFTKSLEPYIRAEWGGEIIFNSFTSNSLLIQEEFVSYLITTSNTKSLDQRRTKRLF